MLPSSGLFQNVNQAIKSLKNIVKHISFHNCENTMHGNVRRQYNVIVKIGRNTKKKCNEINAEFTFFQKYGNTTVTTRHSQINQQEHRSLIKRELSRSCGCEETIPFIGW